MQTYLHASTEIRNHDPLIVRQNDPLIVRQDVDISFLRPHRYCDGRISTQQISCYVKMERQYESGYQKRDKQKEKIIRAGCRSRKPPQGIFLSLLRGGIESYHHQ
jgi:hypothetical protein